MWNEQFTFSLSVPQLAVVRFRVMDYQSHSSNVLVAQYCIPVKCMQQGQSVQPECTCSQRARRAVLHPRQMHAARSVSAS